MNKRKGAYLVNSILPLTKDEIETCYNHLSKEKSPAILSIVPGFAEKREPLEASLQLPMPFTMFFNEKMVGKPRSSILDECVRVFQEYQSTLTEENVTAIELITRGQSSKKSWFKQRDGRITASKLKSVMSADLRKPSVKLIQSICYSNSVTFRGNEATR